MVGVLGASRIVLDQHQQSAILASSAKVRLFCVKGIYRQHEPESSTFQRSFWIPTGAVSGVKVSDLPRSVIAMHFASDA